MLEAEHVAHEVVGVTFDIRTGLRQIGAPWTIFPDRAIRWPVALSSARGEQMIDGVVLETADERVAAGEQFRERRIFRGQRVRIVDNAAAGRAVEDALDVSREIVVIPDVLQGLAARAVRDIVRFDVPLAA
jgi:hypothetical protein